MELRQLKYFVKVAEYLSFSKASHVLYISQSTLSQQIHGLEDELGISLFQRDSHNVSLTEAGKELLPYALETLHSADSCFERIRDLQQLLTGTLNIGVTYSFGPILTETLLEFMKKYPQVKLNIYYRSMEELIDMLRQRELDFVLAFKPSMHFDGIESHVIFDNHLAAIMESHHELAKKSFIRLEELENYDIALPMSGLQARNDLDRLLSKNPVNLNVKIELNEVNILLKLIKESKLVTILSESTIYNDSMLRAIPIRANENEMEGCVHMLRNDYRKHSMKEFIRMLGESRAVKDRLLSI